MGRGTAEGGGEAPPDGRRGNERIGPPFRRFAAAPPPPFEWSPSPCYAQGGFLAIVERLLNRLAIGPAGGEQQLQ